MSIHQSNIQELTLEEVMGDRFGRYSKYIIQERALPDIRDGLKPVQRRILFSMNEDGNTYDKSFRKSAKSVGNIMGNYHPHGDSSIYEAMIRMSQDWKLREILIEMHGNNGSMDGDPAAAMRYTEARLSKLSSELLADIQKDTVEMVWNFDDTEKEPTVLPAKFPNLLVNGSTGISAGYATEIPTHNLGEVIDGTVFLLDHPKATLAEIMQYIPGPDFPTGAILMGADQIKKAYETGKGKVILRAKTEIEPLKASKSQIVISEIPYEVNKANLVKKIDEIRINKKVDGIAEVRDETDRTGLRIVIELKKDANSEGILNYLFKNTDLQINYNFNMVAIDNKRPKQVGLKRILESYIEHRQDVILKRSRFELNKAMKRAHIVAGLIKALSILDQVIATIRGSKNKQEAKQNLMTQYQFSAEQAEAIVMMQLYRLTNTDVTALEAEAQELQEQVEELQLILTNKNKLISVMKTEMLELKEKYANPRLTTIKSKVAEIKIDQEILVPSEQTYIAITKEGYLKRSSLRSVQSSGIDECGLKEGDELLLKAEVNTREHLYLFTNHGQVIYRPVHEISEMKWKDVGDHITQTINNLAADEQIVQAFVVTELSDEMTMLLATKDGMIKQTLLNQLKPWRTYKTKAVTCINLKDNDELLNVFTMPVISNDDLLVVTKKGYALKYPSAEVSVQGLRAAGVKSINLKDDDYVTSTILVPRATGELVIITEFGMVKKIDLAEINELSRAKRGVLIVKSLKRNPHQIKAVHLVHEDDIAVLTTVEDNKYTIAINDLKTVSREATGQYVTNKEAVKTISFLKSENI